MGYYNTGAQKDTAIAKRCKLEKRGGGDEPLDSGWLLPDTRLTHSIQPSPSQPHKGKQPRATQRPPSRQKDEEEPCTSACRKAKRIPELEQTVLKDVSVEHPQVQCRTSPKRGHMQCWSECQTRSRTCAHPIGCYRHKKASKPDKTALLDNTRRNRRSIPTCLRNPSNKYIAREESKNQRQ